MSKSAGGTSLTGPQHFNPPKDCLHFCQASGVVENWYVGLNLKGRLIRMQVFHPVD
jgi:hypothetical protein